jgi:hypothetical protein
MTGTNLRSYFNVGANLLSDRGEPSTRIPTKGALKKLVSESPERVLFDNTSIFGQGNFTPEQLEANPAIVLSVCGPDPYTSRRWYATVTWSTKTGKVTVK